MLGLERHTVRIEPHSPEWTACGACVCREIRQACGGLVVDVEHVGSTAVPDMPAKPILDLAAGVATMDVIQELIRLLAGIGYLHRGDPAGDGGHLFVRESLPDVRTVHLHAVEYGGSQWRDYLLFRDALRRDPDFRRRYGALKQELALRYPDDREAYTASKQEFIRNALATLRESSETVSP